MNNRHLILLILGFIFTNLVCTAQNKIVYKEIDSTKLFLEVYSPEKVDSTKTYPAMVFFFGGGWNGGSTSQFLHHAKYFSKRGIVCFLADYRTKTKNSTTPFESLKDAVT